MSEKIRNNYDQEIELTSEQEKCLHYEGEKTLLIKGLAGAGKSLVLMAIANKYIQKYGIDAKNKVAIFTFQNTLVDTTKEALKCNGNVEDGIVVSTIDKYIKDIYDAWAKEEPSLRKAFPLGKAGQDKILDNISKALKQDETANAHHRFHDVEPEFWMDEFDWMKSMNVWTDDLDYYLTIPRKGRGGKVRMSASDREVAYRLFTAYCNHLNRTKQGDWKDQALYLIRNADKIPEDKKFDHTLIDEAQDLTMAQMIVIMKLFRKDMIVAMDMNQKIHNSAWNPRTLGFETTTQKLTKSMRTTKEIDALAESVRSRNDDKLSEDDKTQRAIPERSGPIPKIVHLKDWMAEQKYVTEQIKAYLETNPDITIGLIAAKNDQIKTYASWLTDADISFEIVKKKSTFSMRAPGVKICTAYGAKGLEFTTVIIPMFAEGNFPFNLKINDPEEMDIFMIKMRNLVYVSMTRARNNLLITFNGNNGSRFIAEMDPHFYELSGEPIKTKSVEPPKNPIIFGKEENEPTIGLEKFLREKGLETVDKRSKGGALWVVGSRDIVDILNESKRTYGALWTYTERGGAATQHRSGWFTKSNS